MEIGFGGEAGNSLLCPVGRPITPKIECTAESRTRQMPKRPVGTPLACVEPALGANSLCRIQETPTMVKTKAQIGNSD
jgi:hypothetical protein